MPEFKQLVGNFTRHRNEVLGIDVGSSGIKIVQLKRAGNEIVLVAADVITPTEEEQPFELPKTLVARYAALCFSEKRAVVKLLSLPGQVTEESGIDAQIHEHMGLDDNDYRIGYKIISEGHARTETKLLSVAMPEESIGPILTHFETGLPVPISIEVSGIAALTAFLQGTGQAHGKEAVGVIEFGAQTTFFALFNKENLALLRKFDFGNDTIIDKIQHALGVDAETARGIASDGSFDISQSVSEVLDPFFRQVVISRDFVERRDQCHVAKIYVSPNLRMFIQGLEHFEQMTGVETDVWDPLAALQDSALPEDLHGQESRFAAAVGCGLAYFEE